MSAGGAGPSSGWGWEDQKWWEAIGDAAGSAFDDAAGSASRMIDDISLNLAELATALQLTDRTALRGGSSPGARRGSTAASARDRTDLAGSARGGSSRRSDDDWFGGVWAAGVADKVDKLLPKRRIDLKALNPSLDSVGLALVERLMPRYLHKAGLACERMQQVGLPVEVTSAVLEAVFCADADDNSLRRVFALFDAAHEIPSADGAETPPHASQVFDTPGDPKFAPLGDIFLGAVRAYPHAAEISRHG